MYWPSKLAEVCADATLPNPVLSKTPSASHLRIAFLPFRFRLQVTKGKVPQQLLPMLQAWRRKAQVFQAFYPV
jgi:hypothetical protein